MALKKMGSFPFWECQLDPKVYKKPTDRIDEKYKRALLNTMFNRAFKLTLTSVGALPP